MKKSGYTAVQNPLSSPQIVENCLEDIDFESPILLTDDFAENDKIMVTLTSESNDRQDSNELKGGRVRFVDAVGIVMGIIIGSGIFSSPGVALQRAGSEGAVLLAWATSGVLVMLAATCYFELAGMMPKAGGDFEYLNRAYGPRAAFAFAWFNFWISKTGSQAIISTIFGRYVERIIIILSSDSSDGASIENASAASEGDGESIISKTCAICLVIGITILNCVSVKESQILQNGLTLSKMLLVFVLFFASIIYSSTHSSSEDEKQDESNLNINNSFRGTNNILGFCTALVACLWSFDGWCDLNFMMEELQNPRDLPKIILTTVGLVTFAYILCNIAYMLVMSVDDIKDSRAVGTDFGIAISNGNQLGFWPIFIAFGVAVSTFGSVHGSVMTGGRAFFAVARDGKAPKFMTKINSLGSPYGAILAQGTWSVVLLCLPGSSFSSLLDYFGPASWLFYSLAAVAVVVLRHKEPNTQRPYKVPLYPLPPLIVVILAVSIIISSIIKSPFFCLLALGFVALSIPFHILYFERDTSSSSSSSSSNSSSNNDDILDIHDITQQNFADSEQR